MSLHIKTSLLSFQQSTSPSLSPLKLALTQKSPKNSEISSLHHSFDNESLIKNQKSIQLSNKHSILRSFVKVDREEASLRDDSSLNRSFKRMSAALRLIGPTTKDTAKLESTIVNSLIPIKHAKIRSKCRSVDLAQYKWVEEETSLWKNKRSSPKSTNKDFQFFLKQLFEVLDEDHSECLTADEFILPLLSYGITSDPKFIEKALIDMYHKEISEISLQKDHFLKLFEEDLRTEYILKSLEMHTRNYLENIEKKNIARMKSLGIRRTETKIEDVVPKKFCTVDEYDKMIKTWWKELLVNCITAKDTKDKIHKSKFMDFLAAKNLVSNKIEAFRLVTTSERMGMIDFEAFEKVFLKAILKSALMNLAEGLNNKKFAGEGDSLAIKLSRCQRMFMVSGIGMKNTVLSMQGRQALGAISKYQANHKESSRARAMVDVRQILEKSEQDAEERLNGYLYKISEDAERFLDNWGSLKSNQNLWEIREKVRNSNEKFT